MLWCAVIVATTLVHGGCTPEPEQVAAAPAPREALAPAPLRPIRVRLATAARSLRIRCESKLALEAEGGVIALEGSQWHDVTVGHRKIMASDRIVGEHVSIVSQDNKPIEVAIATADGTTPIRQFPGTLTLNAAAASNMEVINHVDLERYVACVIAYELVPGFHSESYKAAAIVARTFAIYQMRRRNRAAFDVGATQSAQVYRGLRPGQPGKDSSQAAMVTAGLVCTWMDGDEPRIFSTYYSAACGGVSQSAAMFGPEDDIPPLQGGVVCSDCKIAPQQTYAWGPVTMPFGDLHRVLSRSHEEIRGWSSISSLSVSRRTPQGRPVELTITGPRGQSVTRLAERLRHSLGPTRLRSTLFELSVDDESVTFSNGRGFGHGVGLCQWGWKVRHEPGSLPVRFCVITSLSRR